MCTHYATEERLIFTSTKFIPVTSAAFRCSDEAHGFWTAREDVEPCFFVLASYAAGEEPEEVVRRYMQSAEFAEDIRNFDASDIIRVESTILIPSPCSPLK